MEVPEFRGRKVLSGGQHILPLLHVLEVSNPLTVSRVLPVAARPQCGFTGVAAEAASVEEAAVSTEALQDIEAFSTKRTQVPGTSLQSPHPQDMISEGFRQLPSSSFP